MRLIIEIIEHEIRPDREEHMTPKFESHRPAFPQLTRRAFFCVGGATVAGYSLLPMSSPLNIYAKNKKEPRSSAEVCIFYFLQNSLSTDTTMYAMAIGLGFANGYWAIFVTMAAEHFGTNLRALAATTVPNFVRGSLPAILLLFKWLRTIFGYVNGGWITGIIVMAIALLAAWHTEETFHKDLNYIER